MVYGYIYYRCRKTPKLRRRGNRPLDFGGRAEIPLWAALLNLDLNPFEARCPFLYWVFLLGRFPFKAAGFS